jgi:hypothetical protein
MLIGVKKRFVFVANSKTASTSIERALIADVEIHKGGPQRNKHMFLKKAVREYDFLFDNPKYAFDTFFKFGVMREPLSWLQSWYRYRLGNGALEEGTTFEEFWTTKAGPAARGGKRMQQALYFTKANGELLADYIIPFRNLSADFAKISTELGVPTELPRKNVSKVAKVEDTISEEVLADIRDTLSADYALYDRLDEINARGWERLKQTRPAVSQGAA